jgi:hypothetical protein
MGNFKRLSRGIRKYIRHQKELIRKEVKNKAEEQKLIKELLERFYNK